MYSKKKAETKLRCYIGRAYSMSLELNYIVAVHRDTFTIWLRDYNTSIDSAKLDKSKLTLQYI